MTEDSYDENDYAKTAEFKDFVVFSGMVVHLSDQIKLRFVSSAFALHGNTNLLLCIRFIWQPVVVWDVDRTAARADEYTYLNLYSEYQFSLWIYEFPINFLQPVILNSQDFIPHHTSLTVKKMIDPANRECLVSVANNIPIVSPEWLKSLQETLKKFEGIRTPKELFELPSLLTFVPPVIAGLDIARQKSTWWLPKPSRKLIWKGKTVIMLGGKGVSRLLNLSRGMRSYFTQQPNSEERYFKYLGANIRRVDIMTNGKRIHNLDELRDRIQPDIAAAEQHFQEALKQAKQAKLPSQPWMKETQHVALALSEGVLVSYETSGVQFWEGIMQPLDK
jgi:hypothetical protein